MHIRRDLSSSGRPQRRGPAASLPCAGGVGGAAGQPQQQQAGANPGELRLPQGQKLRPAIAGREGRAFYQNGKHLDRRHGAERLAKEKNLKQREVKFNSDEYFALLAKYRRSGVVRSGTEVDVMLETNW